jgi:hypothetical protein
MLSKIRSYVPDSIKPLLRLFRYRNERKKFVREIFIRKRQNELLQAHYNADAAKLIVFLVIGSEWSTGRDEISGGIISIVSICEETATLREIHGAATIMCTINNAHLLLKHERFQNNTDVYRFSQLKNYFKSLTSVIIHVPELCTATFCESLTITEQSWLKRIPAVHINVMNQNIRLMPEPSRLEKLKQLAGKVTITTAHTQYCNPHYREYFGVPIHKLSVWISPEQYQFTTWDGKENLLVVSPDPHPMKETILKGISTMPKLTVQIIQNITYQEYKKLVSRAKWTLTFGEGLDGYFIEPVFSGAIAFAVYNEIFFTSDFKELPTVYDSMETLAKKIIPDMESLDNATKFRQYQQQQFDLCAKYYSRNQYIKNIETFYSGKYTYA